MGCTRSALRRGLQLDRQLVAGRIACGDQHDQRAQLLQRVEPVAHGPGVQRRGVLQLRQAAAPPAVDLWPRCDCQQDRLAERVDCWASRKR